MVVVLEVLVAVALVEVLVLMEQLILAVVAAADQPVLVVPEDQVL
jgi:hypothetical protein